MSIATFGKIKLNIGEIYSNILIIEYKKLRKKSLAFLYSVIIENGSVHQ